MCAIYGRILHDGIVTDNLEVRLDALSHRGPDDSGVWIDKTKSVVLAHRRLSIIDLSPASRQPLVYEDGRWVIVFNGELFNYIEIRDELRAKGYRFSTDGDTEVVVAAYAAWGADCLERLNGMSAFAIYCQGDECHREHLFMARDRVGKKPLYYRHSERSFEFASELKAIII